MTSDLQRTAQGSGQRFLETYEPPRSDLYRYRRHLTRSPWDAEDLAQESRLCLGRLTQGAPLDGARK